MNDGPAGGVPIGGAEILTLPAIRMVLSTGEVSGDSSILASMGATATKPILPTLANLVMLMQRDPALWGLVGYDEFRGQAVLLRPPPVPGERIGPLGGAYPRPWTAEDAGTIRAYVQRAWMPGVGREDLEVGLSIAAGGFRFHPVRDWLDGLCWDGVPRLDEWLPVVMGTDDTPYHRWVGSKFLIGAVRRVREPGCVMEDMLILEGRQGIGKSRAIRTLSGRAWFTDSLVAALTSRDAAMGLEDIWFCEFGEIEQLIRNEVEVIKGFLSRSIDRYRRPYARNIIERPRQCVLIGTTNQNDYLRDTTGNRRFWPVECRGLAACQGYVNVALLEQHREQIWAEAAFREAAGEPHFLEQPAMRAVATVQQGERLQVDVWQEAVETYIATNNKTSVTTTELLTKALFFPLNQAGKREQMRTASCLQKMGWERRTTWEDGKPVKKWFQT